MEADIQSHSPQQRQQAAVLLAEGDKSRAAIAAELGINKQTLYRWLNEPEFAGQVASLQAKARAAAEIIGIGNKQERMRHMQARYDAQWEVVRQRRERARKTQAGGDTGFVVRKPVVSMGKVVGHTDEYDTGLDGAMAKLEDDFAKETGDRVKRTDTTTGGKAWTDIVLLAGQNKRQRLAGLPTPVDEDVDPLDADDCEDEADDGED